ncbi:penicillin-binding protein activator [Colwellia sp. RSH04]|uniref:penicillin-binding protein activator n=1 Tax=Colwellia sp. RSH04 TaxID=2305464 RepID=UPI002174DE53|nr:penicillin-binding protein activator [Colwellia sp. RSH04]
MGQINFFVFPFSRFTHALRFNIGFNKAAIYSLLLLSLLVLSSCSSQKTTPTSIPTTKPVESSNVEALPITAEQVLAQLTDLSSQQAITKLVLASELFLQEKNYTKALWLADKTLSLLGNDSKQVSNQITLMQVKASSLYALNQEKLSQDELYAINQLAAKNNIPLSIDYYKTFSNVMTAMAQPIAALQADFHVFALNDSLTNEAAIDAVNMLWQKLQALSAWQLTQFSKKTVPYGKGWVQLMRYANKFGHDPMQFGRYLSQWQRQFPTHPATVIVVSLQEQESAYTESENIAVLLPLSGNQASAGIAAQQGLLAAYNNDDSKRLHFYDTHQLNWQSLPTQLNDDEVDFVIGPLLKNNVEHYLATTRDVSDGIEQSNISLPTLLLNLPEKSSLSENQMALSMRPEDEAIQAATTLSNSNYKRPVVLSHQDKVSIRIANAFVEQWKIMTGETVDIVYFEKGTKMQANLKASLDVDTSQNRINELKSRLQQTLKFETRNRRDIDMIYVVGSAEQTRLVKPYIDVNISPFANVIPVYASSRSHSNKHDNSSSRDLQGLTFTEMPWLLNSDMQNTKLKQLSQQLWSKRSDSLLRIFAMGYDSYHLVDKVNQMKDAPYIRHYGQTGILQLNSSNILTRSLIWGRYQQNQVVNIALD